MPIYEYSCRKCGAHVEVMQKVTDKPLARHAGCGGRLEKEWSRTGFQFKGSGWYVTDYAGRKSDAAEASGESKDTKETKDAPKSETASASSTDAPAASKEKKGRASKSTKTSSAPTSGD